MKKTLKFIPLLILPVLLSGCDISWAWWDEDKISIDKYIALSDASKALDDSSKNYTLITSSSIKYSKKTYYKDYLGKFSTETDSNIVESSSVASIKYDNNIIVTSTVTDSEEKFLNAKGVKSYKSDVYSLIDSDKNITIKSFIDYGYGEKTYSESTTLYTNDSKFEKDTSLGSNISSTNIDWNKATYGFSKKNEIIIETMAMVNGSYTVKFNNQTLKTFVTNTYNLYRLKPITDKDNNQTYILDYSYTKIEKLVGSNIFDEPLNEPYLLEKEETTKTYNISTNGEFDLSKIPAVEKE